MTHTIKRKLRNIHTQTHTHTHKHIKNTTVNKKTYDYTYIIVKSYFPKEEITFKFLYLEQILKKYNLSSNPYIDNLRKEDYKLLKSQNINDSFYIIKNKLKPIDKIINPSFIFFNNKYVNLNSRYYGIKALLSNFLNKDKINIIENKTELYMSFNNYSKKLANKYLPITFNINDLDKYKFGTKDEDKNYYILKPIDSRIGSGILYVSSIEEVKKAFEYYKTHKNYKNRFYGNDVIAQEYITKPLLFYKSISISKDLETNGNHKNNENNGNMVGYKCHFRVNFVISCINKKIDSFILNDIIICTAKEPYNMDLPFRKDVHDTHFKSSGGDFFLNRDYKNLHITHTQCNAIINEFEKISKILKNILQKDNNEWLNPAHKNAFEILGIDFMIEDNRNSKHLDDDLDDNLDDDLDDNLNIKLIEVNSVPGFGFNNGYNDHKFLKLLFQELDKHVFSKIF